MSIDFSRVVLVQLNGVTTNNLLVVIEHVHRVIIEVRLLLAVDLIIDVTEQTRRFPLHKLSHLSTSQCHHSFFKFVKNMKIYGLTILHTKTQQTMAGPTAGSPSRVVS